MIRSIELRNYGVHRHRRFPLTRVTLIVGPNESGKTSLFDALCEALSRPDRRKRSEFAERYGEDRSVTVTPELRDPPDIADVLRIAAVRADRLALPPHLYRDGLARPEDLERDWATELRTSLLSSGVDPKSLSVALQRAAGSRAQGTPGKRLKEAREELATLAQSTSRMEAALAALGSRRTESEAARDARKAAEAELSGLRSEAEQRSAELGTAEKAAELARLKEQYRVVDEWSRAAEPTPGLPSPAELQAMRSARDSARERRDSARAAVEGNSRDPGSLARDSLLASTIEALDQLSGQLSPVPAQARTTRGPRPLLLSLLLVLAGLPFSLLVLPSRWRLLAAASVLGVAGLLWIALRYAIAARERRDDAAALQRGARRLQTLVMAARPDLLPGLSEPATLEQLGADLARVKSALAQDLERSRLRDAERAGAAASLQDAESSLASAQEALDRAVRAAGLANEAQLETEVYAAAAAQQSLADLAMRGGPILQELGVQNTAAALPELRRRIADAEQNHVGPAPTESELRMLRTAASNAAEAVADAERRLALAREQEARVSTSVEERSGTVPEDLRKAYLRRDKLSREAADAELEMQAMQLAAEVFGRIGGDDERELSRLVSGVSRRYGRVAGADRSVRLEGIRFSEAVATDYGGAERPVSALSQSTRAALYLGIRLELAERVFAGRVPMLLDEPFVHMDSRRAEETAEMLAEWASEGDRQLVLFSAREETIDLFADVRDRSTIVLDPGGEMP